MSQPLTESVKKLVPWLVAIAFFMEALDTTILNTAVPMISSALGVVPLSMKSVLSSYTLSLAVFIPISSWMADRFGTRRVFATAIGVFTVGSVLCGISTSIHMLVLSRIIQGFGGAMMVPVGRLTIVRTFARSELIRAMSFVAIPALIGPMVGPLAGGLIVKYSHWRMIFFVNLPIGMVGLHLVNKHLPDYRAPRREKLDVVGLILFGSGVALLSYVLEVFGEHALSFTEISGLFGLSVALLSGYWIHSRSMSHPLLRLNLLRTRTLRTAVSGSFVTRLGVGGIPFLLPLLYQVGLGYSPVQSGFLIIPQSLVALSTKITTAKILQKYGFRNVLLVNTVCVGLIIALFATVGMGTNPAVIVLFSSLFGFASSLQFTSMNTLSFADVQDNDTSMASTIVSTMQQMSMSFGVAFASLATALFVPDRLRATTSEEMIHGLHMAFLALGGLTILSSAVFYDLRSDDGDNITQHNALAH